MANDWQKGDDSLAPPHFADSVVRAYTHARRLRFAAAFFTFGCIVAGSVFLMRDVGSEPEQVFAVEGVRVELGPGVIANAEAGAVFDSQRRGGLRVNQVRGSIFYHVDRGSALEVQTAGGTISSNGACFSINVVYPNISVVFAQEGAVTVRNSFGTRVLGLGQRVRLGSGQALIVPSDDVRDVISAPTAPAVSKAGTKRPTALDMGATFPRYKGVEFVNPSREQLLTMAERCQLFWDAPSLSDPNIDYGVEDLPGASTIERAAANEVRRRLVLRATEDLRVIYERLTADHEGSLTVSPQAQLHEIMDKTHPTEQMQTMRQISGEKAGLFPVKVGRAPIEAALRLFSGLGDEFEQEIAVALGARRAHELRAGGWEGKYVSPPRDCR